MERIAQHKILVAGNSFEQCCDRVRKFFDLTSLVIYDCIQVIDELCHHGPDADFFPELKKAEQKNQLTINSLIDELESAGINRISDLRSKDPGYSSKVFHILAHLLDGFIGIDSYFYSIESDSHRLSDQARSQLQSAPDKYWLIHLDCYSELPEEAGILHM
ncbi:hypothetical protein [Desulfosediminicola sp.]|uniref:hypothetical protein n=1 Tax=Desulfosediminicola sp. TaxID=2886825 RepID=UPI003AF2B279